MIAPMKIPLHSWFGYSFTLRLYLIIYNFSYKITANFADFSFCRSNKHYAQIVFSYIECFLQYYRKSFVNKN